MLENNLPLRWNIMCYVTKWADQTTEEMIDPCNLYPEEIKGIEFIKIMLSNSTFSDKDLEIAYYSLILLGRLFHKTEDIRGWYLDLEYNNVLNILYSVTNSDEVDKIEKIRKEIDEFVGVEDIDENISLIVDKIYKDMHTHVVL